MIHSPSDQTTITHLRVRGAGLDPLTAQHHSASAPNTVSLHPGGLSPAAILCIRSLHDPKPGALRLQQRNARPPPEWERATITAIDQLARQAARPIHGAVPTNAEAVLFADRSELLACLASDWIAGELVTRWWWQGLFRNADTARLVITAWLDAAEYVPAALHHLAQRRQAVPFVQALGEEDVRQLSRAVMRAFDLRELRLVLDAAHLDQRSAAPGEAGLLGQAEQESYARLVPQREARRDGLLPDAKHPVRHEDAPGVSGEDTSKQATH